MGGLGYDGFGYANVLMMDLYDRQKILFQLHYTTLFA